MRVGKLSSYLVLFFFVQLHCSSIQEIPEKSFYSTEPSTDFYKFISIPEIIPKKKEKPKFAVHFIWKKDLEDWKDDLKREAIQPLQNIQEVSFVDIAESVFSKTKPEQTEILKENEIEILIEISFSVQKEEIKIEYIFFTIDYPKKIGSTSGLQRIQNPNLENKSIEFYRKEKDYAIVPKTKASYLEWAKKPDSKILTNLIERSLYGNLKLYSSSPATVRCGEEKKVDTPADLRLRAGLQDCHFVFANGHTVKKNYRIKNAEVIEDFIESSQDSLFHSLEVLSFPPGLGVFMDGEFKGYAPIFTKGISRKLTNLEYKRFIKQGNYKPLIKTTVELERGKLKKIILPIYSKNLFNSHSAQFWEVPENSPFGIEMDNYLSFGNLTKEFITGWAGISSFPILPQSYQIDGEFFLPEETGEGVFQLALQFGEKIFSFEVEVDRISVFEFPSRKDKISFQFLGLDTKKSRPFSIQMNSKSAKLTFSLDGKKIYETNYPKDLNWKILICARGGIFNRINILKSLQIEALYLAEKQDKY